MCPPDRLRALAFLCCLTACYGCVEPRYPDEFDEVAEPVWAGDAAVSALVPPVGTQPARDAGATFQPVTPTSVDAGKVASGDPPLGDAGTLGSPSGRPEAGTQLEASVLVEAGAAVDAGSEPSGGSVSSCTITASTDASDTLFYNGQYGCAVWIGNASNKLVKAFFVATRVANRSGLPTYKTASSSTTVDVVAGATLRAAKQHQYTWNLKDTSGAAVPAGEYKLYIETHSSNGVTLVSVPFDVSAGPVSESASPDGEVRSASIECD